MKLITLFLFLIFSCPVFAESDKPMGDGYIKVPEANYIKYMNLIKKQKSQIEILESIDESQKRLVKVLEDEVATLKDNQGVDKNIFDLKNQLCAQKEEHIKWADARIVSYREEVKKLESSNISFFERIQTNAFWPLVIGLGGCVGSAYAK